MKNSLMEGESFFKASVELGLEGTVAKRRDNQQDFVVGGYTIGSGSRAFTFGSLLVGCYEGDVLRYAGRVGSGFNMEMLEALMEPLELLAEDRCPFAQDRELARTSARWVSPKIVVSVKFAEWTDEDRLRAPVFMGLRTDIDPSTVHRQT